jgi:hypothetical protein
VIGNADYKVGPLQNPVNDAAAVARAFEGLGYDKVVLKQNLDIDRFRTALMEISREATGAEQGVVYFAGHGVEAGGRNYLVPVDARWRGRAISTCRRSRSTPSSPSWPASPRSSWSFSTPAASMHSLWPGQRARSGGGSLASSRRTTRWWCMPPRRA